MNIEIQLDDILNIILKSTSENKTLSFETIKTELKYENRVELQSLLNYLQHDQMIDCLNKVRDGNGNIIIGNINKQELYGNPYYATIKGKLFEGYVSRKKKRLRDGYHQTVTLWLSAVGASLAGLYALFEILKWAIKAFCQ